MTIITGREPRLYTKMPSKKGFRLSARKLGTMMNILSPHAISLDAAAAMLRSDDFYVRWNAAQLLGKRGDRAARLVLEKALEDSYVTTRASAARQLHRFSWYTAQTLYAKALADDDYRVRETAVYSLCDCGDLNAYALLVDVLQRGQVDDVYAAVAWGLRERQDAAAVPVLEAALAAQEPDVRGKVLESLGSNNTPQAAAVVEHVMKNDPAPEVQYNAVQSLLELQGELGFPTVADSICRKYGAEREAVIRGFFHACNYLALDVKSSRYLEHVLNALRTAIQDDMPAVRIRAAFPLAWIRDPRAEELLKILYDQEQDPAVKAEILNIAASLLSPIAGQLRADSVGSPHAEIREMLHHIDQHVVDAR